MEAKESLDKLEKSIEKVEKGIDKWDEIESRLRDFDKRITALEIPKRPPGPPQGP